VIENPKKIFFYFFSTLFYDADNVVIAAHVSLLKFWWHKIEISSTIPCHDCVDYKCIYSSSCTWSLVNSSSNTSNSNKSSNNDENDGHTGDRRKPPTWIFSTSTVEWRPLGFEKIGGLNLKSKTSKVEYFGS
jgi:hypothetical protein